MAKRAGYMGGGIVDPGLTVLYSAQRSVEDVERVAGNALGEDGAGLAAGDGLSAEETLAGDVGVDLKEVGSSTGRAQRPGGAGAALGVNGQAIEHFHGTHEYDCRVAAGAGEVDAGGAVVEVKQVHPVDLDTLVGQGKKTLPVVALEVGRGGGGAALNRGDAVGVR